MGWGGGCAGVACPGCAAGGAGVAGWWGWLSAHMGHSVKKGASVAGAHLFRREGGEAPGG